MRGVTVAPSEESDVRAFAVSLDVVISCGTGSAREVAVVAEEVLSEFSRQDGAARTDLAGSPATGEYTFMVIVDETEADGAAAKAATLLRAAAHTAEVATPGWPSADELHVRNVRVHEIAPA